MSDAWRALASDLKPCGDAFIGGKRMAARTYGTFASVNPATGKKIAQVADCGAVDVDNAVSHARQAFACGAWHRTLPAQRKRVLVRFGELVQEHAAELALLESVDMGKLVSQAHTADIPHAADVLTWYGEAVDKEYGQVAPTGYGDLALVARQPLGVIGAVTPWNFPVGIACWKIAPALAAGNSVVLKPSERASLSVLRLGELACEAGLPDGVLNIVPGQGPVAGRALAGHQDVDCMAFTGSTNVARRLLEYAARSNLKPVHLECGGKSAMIVFDDVEDLRSVAEHACNGIFRNQGAICSATSRLLVHRSLIEEVTALVVEGASAFRPGDPLLSTSGMGALVDDQHLQSVLDAINQARTHFELAAGGTTMTVDGAGYFLEPTIFTCVENTSPLAQKEIFGPVLAIIPFDTEAEAVRLANDSPFGLSASVWTTGLERAHRVAAELNVGTVSINTVDAISATTPFGGTKFSGTGRDLSLHALDSYTTFKTTWLKYEPESS
ncbi:aldehyde dehydrogenase [Streptomyces sp. NPDC001139]